MRRIFTNTDELINLVREDFSEYPDVKKLAVSLGHIHTIVYNFHSISFTGIDEKTNELYYTSTSSSEDVSKGIGLFTMDHISNQNGNISKEDVYSGKKAPLRGTNKTVVVDIDDTEGLKKIIDEYFGLFKGCKTNIIGWD
jgi:hypothetical protein